MVYGRLEGVKRYRQLLAVLVCDLDRLKQVNDPHGNAFGERALQHITILIETMRHRWDGVHRLGGEEFAIPLPSTHRTRAIHAADRLRRHMENKPLDQDG